VGGGRQGGRGRGAAATENGSAGACMHGEACAAGQEFPALSLGAGQSVESQGDLGDSEELGKPRARAALTTVCCFEDAGCISSFCRLAGQVRTLLDKYDAEEEEAVVQLGAGGRLEADRARQREEVRKKLAEGAPHLVISATRVRVAARAATARVLLGPAHGRPCSWLRPLWMPGGIVHAT
jgi:hypothetical protein